MPKKYELGQKRYVIVKKEPGETKVKLFEDSSNKSVTFPIQRWAQFVAIVPIVDQCLDNLRHNLQFHVGRKWYICVTSGFKCVDVRQFYWNPVLGVKPTRKWMAIRLHEWDRLKEVIQQLHTKFPLIAAAEKCSSQPIHFNQESALLCLECNPYQGERGFVLPNLTIEQFNSFVSSQSDIGTDNLCIDLTA